MPCRRFPQAGPRSTRWPAFFPLVLTFLALGIGASTGLAAENDPSDEETKKKDFTANDLTEEQWASLIRPAADRPSRLRPGEQLVYKIGWGWVSVGEARLSLQEDTIDGQPVLRMELRARTNSFADTFYKVRNTTRAWIDEDVSGVLHYEASQREGDREREVVVEFNAAPPTARYENRLNGDSREPIAIPAGTWDPMSITYFVRSLTLAVGDEMIIPTTNGKKLYLTRVEVKKRVKKKFKSGEREAFLVEPDIEDLGGVFRKSKNAAVRFWFSADELQLPLRMESEVSVGKFWAELVRIENIPTVVESETEAEEEPLEETEVSRR